MDIYKVHLRDTQTGETAVHEDGWNPAHATTGDQKHGGVIFMYGDGNYGCDCNRWLFLQRALGRDPRLNEAACGDGRIVVDAIYAPDGTLIYQDEGAITPKETP